MEELGQQSMLERGKPRSLIVPKGCTSWWGVDPSTRGVSIAWIAADGARGVRSSPAPGDATLGQRFSLLYAGAYELAYELASRSGVAPGLIGVEQPSGSSQHVNHPLEFAVGCIVAGVYDGARAVAPPAMELLVASWWKLRSCGNGAAKKTRKVPGKKTAQALPLEEYEVMRWARLNGYEGQSWDEADAMGMAAALRGDVDLVAR